MNKELNYKEITVLIVEDNVIAREVLHSMLSIDFKYVHQANNGCDGLEIFIKYKPDIILTDIEMPCASGLDMLDEIRKIDKETLVIFTTAHEEVAILQKAIDLKATAYLIKPIRYDDILEKIDSNLLIKDPKTGLQTTLSKREYEVFLDIVKGIKPLNIALKYDVKPKTISTYRNRILDKFKMKSNAELIKYALQNNIL